ncbi:MAG: hypothetical protein RSF40_00960 [Oscillospiraceae bacterium]
MTITEKVSYLRGLAEGLAIDETTKEGKLFAAIIDTLDDMAFSISDVEDNLADISEQVDLIDEDLDVLEEEFYGDDEDDDDCDCDCDCDCDDCDDDDELYEVKCPACGDTICVDDSMLDEGEMDCPNCGEHLEFDFGCDCDDDCKDDCCCGHDCDCDK